MPAAARIAAPIRDCRTTPLPLIRRPRIGRTVMNATTGISGNSSQNTQRHPSPSVIVPATAGAMRLGNTHPAER